nr:fatty acid amide hydrolase-like [Nicotiana tomentosiformis]
MRLAHYVTIGSECNNSIARELEKLNKEELGWDARVALSVYGSFSSQEYLNAQRIRNRQLQIHKRIFSKADVIVTPTTGVTAYTIQKDARETGELDYINGGTKLGKTSEMPFWTISNFVTSLNFLLIIMLPVKTVTIS